MTVSVAYYAFPDDDCVSLDRVLTRMSSDDRLATIWRPTEDWLLEVSPGVARALTEMFAEAGVHQPDTDWRPGGVLVPEPMRASVEGVLRCVPEAVATWSRIEGVDFATTEARQAFEAAI